MKPTGTIAFSSGRALDFDIWSYNLATEQLSQLTSGDNLNDQPVYSPDGKQIAYIVTEQDCIPSLWLMHSDGTSKQRLTEKFYCQNPSWTPDGRSILFSANSSDGNNIDIVKLNLDSGSHSVEGVVSSPSQELSASLSPCGNKIVLCEQRQGNDTEIKQIDLGSREEKIIASHPSRDFCPKYSPDGKSIAFISSREGFDVNRYNQLTAQISDAVKTSDMTTVNTLIAELIALDGDSEIFIVSSSGGEVRQLTHDRRSAASLCWSPCGKFICYASCLKSETAVERIRIVEVDSGRDTELTIDRSALEREIGAAQLVNASLVQKIVPDWIERKFASKSFWGEEKNPTWTA